MADIGEEGGLGTVNFGERFGALAFLLKCPRICNGCSNLPGHELQKALVLVVKYEARAETDNQKPGHCLLGTASGERNNNRSLYALRKAGGSDLTEFRRETLDNQWASGFPHVLKPPKIILIV